MKRRLLKSVPTLTAAEVAAELGVTDAAVRKARKNGRLLAVEFGGRQRMDDPDRGDGDPPWFGPAPGERPGGRFGDPLRTLAATVPTFGRCYLGVSHEAAFAVSFLRRPPLAAIDRATVDGRDMAEIVITRPLRLVALLGPGLKAAGATAAVSTGPQSTVRRWARALWEHPSVPDGIAYRCRHEVAEVAVALFDRARRSLQVVRSRELRDDRTWFGATLDSYLMVLDPP